MRLYRTNKKVLLLDDPGWEFLQNYTANTLSHPKNVFTDIKGRVVATLDQLQVGENKWIAVIEKHRWKPLMEHLSKYLPLCKAEIHELNQKVYFDLDEEKEEQEVKEKEEGSWILPQKRGRLWVTLEDWKNEVLEEEFTRFRVIHKIPLEGVDFQNEMVLNIHPTEYVSFTKGCFLGQEVLSRVHFKSQPPKKLVVKAKSEVSEEEAKNMTSLVYLPEKKDWYGFLFISNKDKKG